LGKKELTGGPRQLEKEREIGGCGVLWAGLLG
jgi:hypothetical protein